MALKDTNKVVVAVKYGATITKTTDTIAIVSPDVRFTPKMGMGSDKCLNGKLGSKNFWRNTDDVTVEGAIIQGYLTGNDSTGSALSTLPDWDDMYLVCGLDKKVSAGVSVSYTPSQNQPSDSSEVALWRDGEKRTLTGAIGTLTISGKVGEQIKQTVSVSGYTTMASVAEPNPTAPCVDNALLLVLKSTDTMTFTGTAYKGQDFTLTQGNEIKKKYFIGVKDYDRTDFDSTLEVTYLKDNENILTDFSNGTAHNIVIKAGSTNGKSVKITCANAIVSENPTDTSIDGKEAYKVKFSLQGDANGLNQFVMLYGTTA